MKEIQITIKTSSPAHDLAIAAVCEYFDIDREYLFSKSKTREHSRKKSLAFYLMKNKCHLTDNDIANICGTTRQNVSSSVEKIDVRKGLYLQSSCDYQNILVIFSTLLKNQEEWQKQHLL